MPFTRRGFVRGALVATAALAAGGSGAWLLRDDAVRRARRAYHQLTDPPVPPAPTGPLDAATAAALAAAAEALVGEAGRRSHYLESFRWRAAQLPGRRRLYRRFTRLVDAAAAGAGAARFAHLDPGSRRRLLARLFPAGRLRRALLGWAAGERMLLRRHVVREILEVYAATDAWTDLGYGSWPGTAQGLAAYREPPPGAEGPA